MKEILNTIKDIYSSNNKGKIHSVIFILSGLIAITEYLSVNYAHTLSNVPKFDIITSMKIGEIIFGLWLFTFIIKILITGYSITFTNLKLNNISGLPNFTPNDIIRGLCGTLLGIVWGIGIILIALTIIGILLFICSRGIMLLKILSILLIMLLSLSFVVISPFLTFLTVNYSKHFSLKGLFNPKLLVCYIKSSFNEVLILLCKLVVVGIVFMLIAYLISIIITAFINIIGLNIPRSDDLFFGILSEYAGIIITLITLKCLSTIYKNKVEPELIKNMLIQ